MADKWAREDTGAWLREDGGYWVREVPPASPTFVAEYEGTDWSTGTTPKTASVTTAVGDVLAILSGNSNATDATPTALPTGGTGTYVNRATAGNDAGDAWARIDTVSAGVTAQSYSLSQARGSSNQPWGLTVARFSGSDGIGAAANSGITGTAPSLAITTLQANSALAVIVVDWNAADGASRTWLTVNGFTPTAGNGQELVYFRDAANYTVYVAYYPDAGAVGSKTVGLSAPGGTNYAVAAVEIKGTLSAGTNVSPALAALIAALPLPTISAGANVSPAAIALALAAPLPTPKAAATVSPAVAALTAALPTPGILAGAVVTPAVDALIMSLLTPSVLAAANVSPALAALIMALPNPTTAVGSGAITVTPAVAALIMALATPTILAGANVSPALAALLAALPTPAISAGANVSPAVDALLMALPTPAALAAATVTPALLSLIAALPTPGVLAGAVVTPAVAALIAALPTPGISAAAPVAPALAALLMALPTPVASVGSGPITVTPALAALILALPTPVAGPLVTVTPATLALERNGYLLSASETVPAATSPDHASFDIVGDLDLRAYILLPDYTAGANNQAFLAKAANGTAGESFWFQVLASGSLELVWFDSAGTQRSVGSSAPSFVDGTGYWVRVTLDVDNGSGQAVVTFYTSTQAVNINPATISWTQLSTHTPGIGVSSIRSGNADVWLGGRSNLGQDTFTGRTYYAEIRDGIGGTIVADPDWRDGDQRTGHSPVVFTDSQGRAWTVGTSWVDKTISVPRPTISAGANVSPAADALVMALPTPVASGGGPIMTPATIALLMALANPTVAAAAKTTPALLPLIMALATPTITTPAGAFPATFPLLMAMPTPGILAGAAVTPAAVALSLLLPNPAASIPRVVTPALFNLLMALANPTAVVAAGTTATPATIGLVIATPLPSLVVPSRAFPGVLDLLLGLPTPNIIVWGEPAGGGGSSGLVEGRGYSEGAGIPGVSIAEDSGGVSLIVVRTAGASGAEDGSGRSLVESPSGGETGN